MQHIPLTLRLTHHYVGGHDHLDRWAHLGTARLLPSKCVRAPADLDDGGTYLRWAILPRYLKRLPEAVRALEDTLTREGCSHEWDCCGCASYRTRLVRKHGRRVLLKTEVSYNY